MTLRQMKSGIPILGLLAIMIGITDVLGADAELAKVAVQGSDKESNDGLAEKLALTKKKDVELEGLSHAELIEHLSNEDFLVREKASRLIWERGKPTLKLLEEAVLSGNPELISRATELIRYVKVGISPNTPPHIAKLVQSFAEANNDGKEDIMRELYAEKAYSQMLFMISEMEDRALAKNLYNDFNRLAHDAAQESLIKGDIDAAIEQLKLAPKSDVTLRSLAFLYAHTGRLEEEIDKLKDLSNELLDKEWERHLNLEKTDRKDIRKFAKRESLMGVIANLDLLEGDPKAMYEYYSNQSPFATKTGLAVLKSQYAGESEDFIKKSHAKQLKVLELFKGNKPTDLLNQTVKSMCLTGAVDLVESYMVDRYRYQSFEHLDRRERPKEALAAIGIVSEESLQKFIKENTRLTIEEYELEEKDKPEFRGGELLAYLDRLLAVAEFYYNRGLPETSYEIVTPLLKELEVQENNEWYKVVEAIADRRMHDLAVRMVLERGDDDNTYEQMVTYLYDDTIDTDLVWTTLLNREGVTPEKSFRDLGVIMGVYQEEIETYTKLQDELIKIANRQGVVSLKSMREALLSVAMYRQDSISAQKYAKQLLDNEDLKTAIALRKLEYLRELANCLDWKAIVALLDEDSSFIGGSPRWHAVYSIAKRKTGDKEGADRILQHAKLISVGLNDELRDIAVEHELAGYHDISSQIIERILIVAAVDRDSHLYEFALNYLSDSDNAYVNKENWGKAAAFFFIKAVADLVEEPIGNETLNLGYYTNDFYNAQFTRGIELYKVGKKAKAVKMLGDAHRAMVGEGVLADYFYPVVRETGIRNQYDLWVEESYEYLRSSLADFPESSNTHNTASWVLSRAVRKLDAGFQHSKEALRLTPFEASYIDTMGELWHASGNREKAVEWGEKAVMASKYGRLDTLGRRSSAKLRTYSLVSQLDRFKNKPHPKP